MKLESYRGLLGFQWGVTSFEVEIIRSCPPVLRPSPASLVIHGAQIYLDSPRPFLLVYQTQVVVSLVKINPRF